MTRAIILAAGVSAKFFKPLYDKPKGLFQFQGELLIERQIRQLKSAGVSDIAVVLGYEKEQFFYLEDKFNVKLYVNEKYLERGNIGSLLVPPHEWIEDSFICYADHWYAENPFINFNSVRSVHMLAAVADARREFVVSQKQDGRLTSLRAGSASGLCLSGFAYFTADFAKKLVELYQLEKDWLGVSSEHWEQFWGRHEEDLPLYGHVVTVGWREFDSLNDFQTEDQGIVRNFSKQAVDNICSLLKCKPSSIRNLSPLNKGLTNASFSFTQGGEKYVYRYPGYSSSNLVNREAEVLAQQAAIDLGIDSSVIAIGVDGWKLSHFIRTVKAFDYEDEPLLEESVRRIRAFHEKGLTCNYVVNLLAEGDRLLSLASNKKGEIAKRHKELRTSLQKLWHYTELDGVKKVLCHNDTYAVNWLIGEQNQLCLIDWEYAGMNDPVNDIATTVVRDSLSDQLTEKMLTFFYGHKPTLAERRHAYAYFAMTGWYWYCWSLFKDTLGEDGFFMLSSWRGIKKYLPMALDLYRYRG